MSKKLTIASAVILASAAAAANAQQACTTYSVQPGDSLSAIAREAYGSISYQRVWDANRDLIGSNPNAITVGMKLALPCEDGSLPGARAVVTKASATPEAPQSALKEIRLVTGSDYQPFTDESMQGGGIFTQVVRAAMDTMEPRYETDITFVNDWGSHMDVLLPSGAFDGTFPWVLPNCEDPAITDDMQARCDNFLFANPVYEIVTGVITRGGDPLATSSDHADFKGKTVCVPDGYSAIVLPAGGLTDDDVTYVRPANPDTCFEDLVAGKVDVVELELSQASDIVGRLGLTDMVAVSDQLTSVSVLTVYVHKENPDAAEILAALNEGIATIRNNGVWFQTVQSGFSAYYDK